MEAPWMYIAYNEMGTAELMGVQTSARIKQYLETVALPPGMASHDETPWCSAFVNYCLFKGLRKGNRMANARSFITFGTQLPELKWGAIAVLKRGNSEWQGHVGFVEDWNNEHVCILGGNQDNRVKYSFFPLTDILNGGIRWPV